MFNPYQNNLSLFKSLIENKNPQNLFEFMINTNPNFRQFVDKNKDKTIEDIAMEYDLDLDLIKKFM